MAEKNAPGFNSLSGGEKDAILYFTILWSLFEAEVLDKRACVKRIESVVRGWRKECCLDESKFKEHLEYFKSRYSGGNSSSNSIDGLGIKKERDFELVRSVVFGENLDPVDGLVVLFIIIYRLRNNLFHGVKWDVELKGQLGNLRHASYAIISALNIHNDA